MTGLEGPLIGLAGSTAQNLGILTAGAKTTGYLVYGSTKKADARTDAEHVFSMAAELIRGCPRGHVFTETSAQWLLHVRELLRKWESVVGNTDINKKIWANLGDNIDVLELANVYGRARTPARLTEKSKIRWWNLYKKGRTPAKVGQKAQKLITRHKEVLSGGDPTKVYEPAVGSPQLECPSVPEYMALECRSETMDKIISSIQNHHFTHIYGPAGIGKTTMLVQIIEQIKHKFQGVVHVQVSRSPDKLTIQQVIADKLAVSFEGTDIDGQKDVKRRAEKLVEGIKNIGGADGVVLIVLDDVWRDLNLSEIGIPTGGNVKVLIGTRMSNLTLNNYDNKISVGFLTKEDSWLLFKKAASLNGDEDFIETAEDVKRLCFGLPLALAVIGRTLSGQDKSTWEHALGYLKESKIKAILGNGDATEFLCQVIEYSYKHLYTSKIDLLKADKIDVAKADNIARNIFRLCCLFPENADIPREDLKKYLIAEDAKMEFKHFDIAILKLLQCHLLKPTPKRGILKMHAVVRDVAVYLAKKEDHAVINCGTKTKINEEIVTSNGTVSVMGCNITGTVGFKQTNWLRLKRKFVKEDCASVHTLLLRNNYTVPETKLPDLPGSFFERMGDLTVLDLSYSEITKLPASMEKLENVKTLVLNGCKDLKQVDKIAKLWRLRVLSLRETALTSLPTGMSNLVYLIVLELTPARGCVIQNGFFSGLPRLQVLFLASESLSDEALKEIIELQSMEDLRLYVNNTVLSSSAFNEVKTRELWTEFTISSHLEYDPMSLKKNLHIKDLDTANEGVKLLLEKAEHLIIENSFPLPPGIHSDLTKITGVSKFTKTKILHLMDCGNIQYLSSAGSSGWEKLEVLELTRLEKFEGIFEGTVSDDSFSKVREITFRTCNMIGHVMPDNAVQKLQKKMQKITVIGCDKVKYIFGNYSGLFDVLKLLELRGLLILENIWVGVPPQGTFAKLKELIVINCHNLVCVFTSSLAAMLTSLQKLTVENNRELKAIVQWDGTDNLNSQVFLSVTHVSIEKLENLEYFHGEPRDIDLKWPSLVQLRLGGCGALTRFPIGQESAPYMTRVYVTSRNDIARPWYTQLVTTASRFEIRVAYDLIEEDE